MAMMTNGPGAVVLGPVDRAAAVAAVKARLRVASGDEEPLIAAFAETALGLAERFTGQVAIVRTVGETVLPGGPPQSGGLPGGPPQSGGWQRLSARPVRTIGPVMRGGIALAATDYAVDIDGAGIGWVRVAGGPPPQGGAVTVSYTTGTSADWAGLPAAWREGAAMLAAHLFDDRTGTLPIPAAVTALWRPWRVLRLGSEVRA